MASSGSEESVKPRRVSVFRELLDDEDPKPMSVLQPREKSPRPQRVRFKSEASIIGVNDGDESEWEDIDGEEESEALSSTICATAVPSRVSRRVYRLGVLLLLLAISFPMVQRCTFCGASARALDPRQLEKRADSSTVVCKRWAGQSALINGTIYYYGGHVSTSPQQQDNTWTNDFVSLDLTKTWQISTPSLTGLAKPSGPPSVALGALWNSHSSLYLYGGQFSDSPVTSPVPFSLWEYNIGSKNWIEHKDPKSSNGDHSPSNGDSIQRAAEGASYSVAALGRGWYFGGHLDGYTTPGWSQSIQRVYIKSLLEFTFPGFANHGVQSLSDGKTAGSDGVWRNVTDGGTQDTAGFPERADGLLTYVPGFGNEGILLGLTGGTNSTFTQMNIIDVYDIATSTWYKQSTSGTAPKARVNPCAVVAAAPDGSSYNMYMFGGQNLQPYKEQIQYDDMWILSIPSFTWIQVDTKSQVPPARAGHTCHIWDGQMVVVGGYVGQDLSCDSPGIYVFNLTSLQWANQFSSLTGSQSGNTNAENANPFSQQMNQRKAENASRQGLEGSYGYQVPNAVISAIGGGPTGGATVTAPVQTPTGGPLATGKPVTYTVTGPNGAVITQTGGAAGGSSSSQGSGSNTKIVAIVVGVVAGILAIVAAYFAFCAWVYRRQLQLYKNHVAMAQREALDPARAEKHGMIMPPPAAAKNSSERSHHRSESGYQGSHSGSSGAYAAGAAGGAAAAPERRSSDSSSSEDLLNGQEPSFWGTRGVLLNPRRSLRVINRD